MIFKQEKQSKQPEIDRIRAEAEAKGYTVKGISITNPGDGKQLYGLFRLPTSQEFEKMRSKQERNQQMSDYEIVADCLLFPSINEFETINKKYFGTDTVIARKLIEFTNLFATVEVE